MKLPSEICALNDRLLLRWKTYYAVATSRDRKLEEGLWRRTQEPENANESGWRAAGDGRRRLLHYRYTYDVVERLDAPVLCLATLYIMYCVTYPEEDLARVHAGIIQALQAGGWIRQETGARWRRGDVSLTLLTFDRHPMDDEAGRGTPAGYRSLEIILRSDDDQTGPVEQLMPWDVLSRGMRLKDERADPIFIPDLALIADYLPFHVEVGCGLSVESGIPPLHYLHDLYQVTDRSSNTFVLDSARDDVIPTLLTSPEVCMPALTSMYRACFLAEPGVAHHGLKQLAELGHITGPVMTNNVDALIARAGLAALNLRRYDQDIPDVDFDSRAKSLLVIGSHADRRRVQRRARQLGLAVFFVDPEGYWENGVFTPYPLEGTRPGDYLCRRCAGAAIPELVDYLANVRAAV
jgi:hypothetical protein